MVTSPKCTFLGLEIYIILILKYFMFLNFEKLLCSFGRGLNFSAPRTLHRIRALGMALRRNCPTHSMVLYCTAPTFYRRNPYFAHLQVNHTGPTRFWVYAVQTSTTPTPFPLSHWKDIFWDREMRWEWFHICTALWPGRHKVAAGPPTSAGSSKPLSTNIKTIQRWNSCPKAPPSSLISLCHYFI